MQRIQNFMKRFADKHRKKMIYEIDDKVYLSSRNIIISRSSRKLENKMLNFYSIVQRVKDSYKLRLPVLMKIHSVFAVNLLRKNSEDSLSGQTQKTSKPIVTSLSDEYELKDIEAFR